MIAEPPDDQDAVELPDAVSNRAIWKAVRTPTWACRASFQGPSPLTGDGANQVQPNVSVTVAVTPQQPIPAAPLILPATPGYGSWGTELVLSTWGGAS